MSEPDMLRPESTGETVPECCDLLILDDIFPSDFSPFRTIEYGHFLDFFDARLGSLEGWHVRIGNESFAEARARLPVADHVRARIHRFDEVAGIVARLAYVTFLGNAHALLPFLTGRDIPFILQLYPGGGFGLDQPEIDEQLRQVLLSPLCRKVIVTQTATRDYVVARIGVDPGKVAFIYGGVFESRNRFEFLRDKRRHPEHKPTLDLCFVAHKYGDDLVSKGYDRFVAIAQMLAGRFPQLRFHVVGDYGPADVPLGDAADRFTFYGRQPSDFFAAFYPRMDAIVSLNTPFVLAPGAFDGFPTGACIEAGFRGVLNCISDPLGLNFAFEDMRDIVLLGEKIEDAAAKIAALLGDPARLHELSYANWRRFHEVFGTDAQLWARTRLIVGELTQAPLLVSAPGPHAAILGLVAHEAAARARIAELEAVIRQSAALDAEKEREIEGWRRLGRQKAPTFYAMKLAYRVLRDALARRLR